METKTTQAQARYLAQIARQGGTVTSKRMLRTGELNVHWIARDGTRLAANVHPEHNAR